MAPRPGHPTPEPAPQRRVPLVTAAPALTRVAWSSQMVAQQLEALFVFLGADGARQLRPIHAEALRIGWPPDRQPGDLVVEAAERYGLSPILVHSTSWRFENARVVLTYLVAVEPPASGELNQHHRDEPVLRADLARGDALAPPPQIGVSQVIEHAFRHLSWLVKDDDAVRAAIPEWVEFLSAYGPEPFRSFGPPGPP